MKKSRTQIMVEIIEEIEKIYSPGTWEGRKIFDTGKYGFLLVESEGDCITSRFIEKSELPSNLEEILYF